MALPEIGVIVGSARKESINAKLAVALAQIGAEKFGFRRIKIDDLPMFNQDLESNRPDAVIRFKAEVAKCQGILFVTPEYNRSVPALLKNALDWASRPNTENVWLGKAAATIGTSPGATGTASAQLQLRQMIVQLGMVVQGQPEVYLQFTPGLIDDSGNVTVQKSTEVLTKFIGKFSEFVANHSAR